MSDPAGFPPLVVGTDRAAVLRLFRPILAFIVVVCVVVTLAAVTIAALLGSLSGFGLGLAGAASLLIVGGYLFFLALHTATTMTARAAAGTVLTLDATGMRWVTPQGSLDLPWDAVDAVTLRGSARRRVAVYRLNAAVSPTSPGVRTDIRADILARATKSGMRLGSVGLDQPLDTILAATSAFTAGRLVAR
ncbi:hypothetical protein [Schumannella sp. 10F1B-5-1]|uniref:hypothetical protein n=1 Tax=Schumannella sp. 10F1B-5-1 TaxID=2590780 RepID=UPI001130E54F|nr:hypothetical protein [Schumannella sp. 10F1B-5-1]TPW71639.1 hypothetical protein FJ658_09810 [Schumannella sp. 10F1B-5-1]